MASATNKKTSKLRAVLSFLSNNTTYDKIKLRRDTTIIGREKGDIIINDPEVSSSHCQIQQIDNDYHLFDMNSTNGTYVNNNRIVKAMLKDNDIIKIGSSILQFNLENEEDIKDVPTIFKSLKESNSDQPKSLIKTMIETELKNTTQPKIKLSVTYNNGKTEEIILNQQKIFIGRASSFGSFDKDSEISRKHLLVKLNNTGEIFIEDMNSTNGTFVNNKKITGMVLVKQDDDIRIGYTHIKINVIK